MPTASLQTPAQDRILDGDARDVEVRSSRFPNHPGRLPLLQVGAPFRIPDVGHHLRPDLVGGRRNGGRHDASSGRDVEPVTIDREAVCIVAGGPHGNRAPGPRRADRSSADLRQKFVHPRCEFRVDLCLRLLGRLRPLLGCHPRVPSDGDPDILPCLRVIGVGLARTFRQIALQDVLGDLDVIVLSKGVRRERLKAALHPLALLNAPAMPRTISR